MSYSIKLLAIVLALGACSDTGLRSVEDTPQTPEPPRVCDDVDVTQHEVSDPIQCWEEAGWSEPVLKWFEPDIRAYAAGPLEDTNGDGMINRDDALFLVGGNRAVDWESSTFRVNTNTATLDQYARRGRVLLDVGNGLGHRLWSGGTDYTLHAWSPVHKTEVFPSSETSQSALGLTGLPFRTASLDGPHEVSSSTASLSTFTNHRVFEWETDEEGNSNAVVVDLNDDGLREVILPTGVGNLDGTLRCKREHKIRSLAFVDIDGDGAPETVGIEFNDEDELVSVVIADECDIRTQLYVGDGSVERPVPFNIGSFSIADFNGDGSRWIVFVAIHRSTPYNTFSLNAIDSGGNLQWKRFLSDGESFSHPLAVDFDGDGAYELVVTSAGILSGATGDVLAPLPVEGRLIRGGTIKAGIMVTDLENDGHLDLLVNTTAGLYAFEGANGWAPGPGCWPHFDYDGVSVDDNCRVPMDPEPAWRTHNSFRAAPSLDIARAQGSDLTVRLLDVCDLDCADDGLRITVQVGNLGTRDIARDVVVEVYGVAEQGRELLVQDWVSEVPAGTWIEGRTYEIPDAAPYADIEVEVRPDGWSLLQCDDDNDTVRLGRAVCGS